MMNLRLSPPLIGTHVSISGGVSNGIGRADRLNCLVMQMFVKSSNRWESPALEAEEVERFRVARSNSPLRSLVAHDSYLINLASPDDALWERSKQALLDELERCELLGLDYLVVHPGAHLDAGETAGISRIARAIDSIQAEGDGLKVKIALETTAGQGTSIGHRFEHLRDILAELNKPERVFICLDTCHVFAAGYDIRTHEKYLATIEQLEAVVGLEKVQVIHFNDSKKALGSRVDRHNHIGEGFIGEDGFRWFLHDARFADTPKILETPKGKDDTFDLKNLAVLRALASKAAESDDAVLGL